MAEPADTVAEGTHRSVVTPLPWPTRLLLAATTRPLRPQIDAPPPARVHLERLAGEGWRLRQCGPRHHALWRDSTTMVRSTLPLAVFPGACSGLNEEDRGIFLLFELLRRFARIELARLGRSHELADEPEAIRLMCRRVATMAWSDGDAWPFCLALLRRAELQLLEAACGWPIRDGPGRSGLLPRHLAEP